MSTDLTLDRLQACNAEITGIQTAWRLPPTETIMPGTLPGIYARPLGMVSAAPGTSAGRYIVTRRYLVRALIAPATGAAIDSSTEGSKLLALAVPFLDRLVDYYMLHPRLDTAKGNGSLAGIAQDVSVQDNGLDIRTGPDGADYVSIDLIITIAEQRLPTTPRLA